MKYIKRNIVLSAAALLLFACNCLAQKINLSVQEFEKAIEQKGIQILDVRTPGEYQSGHLANTFLADWTNQKEFTTRITALDTSKPVYVYCLSGGRSDAASRWLNKNGFTAYSLSGGINAWKRENKPVLVDKPVEQMSKDAYLAFIPKDKTVLVDFGAPWCPPCKKMEPVLEKLKKDYGSKFTLLTIDGGSQTQLCNDLQLDAFPTFILYKQGKPVWRKTGIVDIKDFIEKL